MNEDLKKLIDQYKEEFSSMSEKRKAEEERDLYLLANPDQRGGKREWMVKHLGGHAQHYEQRSMLIMAGPWVNPLWKMFDEGVTRNSIIQLFRQARDLIANKHMTSEGALTQVINTYNSTGYEARTPEGRRYRKMTPMEKQRSQPPPANISIEMDMDTTQNRRSKQFLLRLVALTDEFVRTSLVGLSHIDSLEMKITTDEFTSYVREACDDFRRRVYNMRSSAKKERVRQARVNRDELREAAEVLGISVVWDQDVDLRKAKKIMFRRAAQLHPDKTGPVSNEQKTEFTAVQEAYKTLERYMEGRKSNEVGERSHGQ